MSRISSTDGDRWFSVATDNVVGHLPRPDQIVTLCALALTVAAARASDGVDDITPNLLSELNQFAGRFSEGRMRLRHPEAAHHRAGSSISVHGTPALLRCAGEETIELTNRVQEAPLADVVEIASDEFIVIAVPAVYTTGA